MHNKKHICQVTHPLCLNLSFYKDRYMSSFYKIQVLNIQTVSMKVTRYSNKYLWFAYLLRVLQHRTTDRTDEFLIHLTIKAGHLIPHLYWPILKITQLRSARKQKSVKTDCCQMFTTMINLVNVHVNLWGAFNTFIVHLWRSRYVWWLFHLSHYRRQILSPSAPHLGIPGTFNLWLCEWMLVSNMQSSMSWFSRRRNQRISMRSCW